MAGNHYERLQYAHKEIIENGNLDAADEVFASSYVVHSGSGEFEGPEFAKEFVKRLRKSIPDVTVGDIVVLLEAGDTVTWQRTLSGTHTAKMAGIPASGKRVEWTDMVVSRFEGDQIAEEWTVSELAGELFSKVPAQQQ